MQEQMQITDKLRALINAQAHDNAWYFDVAQLLGINVMLIKKPGWHETVWNKSWGNIERQQVENKFAMVWVRPDGADPVATLDEVPDEVKAIKFALCGELIKALQVKGELSFVKVGYPHNWYASKIYFNGAETLHVVSADAIFGTCVFHSKDAQGNWELSPDKQEFAEKTLRGIVQIVVHKETQSLF